MWRSLLVLLLLPNLTRGLPVAAQTHRVSRPEQVVRAVGVYEWTGDLKKPAASRLVPVTVFIDGALQDAGVYLARPIPFALTPGNQYELQQAGVGRGTLDLSYARRVQTADSGYEDGWFGYGSFKAPPAAKKEPVLRASRNPAVLTSSRDDARPHLSTRSDNGATEKADISQPGRDPQPSSPDQSQPAEKKGSGSSPSDDPDRPTMRRRSDSSAPAADTARDSTRATPAEDPDRPTLRKRSPNDNRKGSLENDVASVTGSGALNDDPDRPNLHRGARASASNIEIAKLVGLPDDLKQMVAVSDAASRPQHDFARPWQDDKERATVLAKLQALARSQLQAYTLDSVTPRNVGDAAPPSASPPVLRRPPASGSAPSHRSAAKAPAPRDQVLLQEDLRGFTLSYGGAPTYTYTAYTAGTGADRRYVTLVAQEDSAGDLRPTIKNVTDEAHLDRTPRMRLVDVVDAEASNRASLLFELRSQSSRQFALYRVLGARATPVFNTGTIQ